MIPLHNSPRATSALARFLGRAPHSRRSQILHPFDIGRPVPSVVRPQRRVIRSRTAAGSGYVLCKRVIDLTLAAFLAVVSLPLVVLVAILIKRDSPGPVLFVQERVGARRRRSQRGPAVWEVTHFKVYKFRSMIQNASESLHQAHTLAFVEERLAATEIKLTEDPRVTRIGRLLRRTSLDEWPQLLNVLKGEMSLVGPRPVPVYEAAAYSDWHWERLAALPGITGWWQVHGRGRVTFSQMIRMDVEYVRHQSLWLDIKILFATIPAVVSGRGAE
jgi:lipopolysaccharide/colanic/teichoic acid biosynthesis glycosyltransferase